MLPLKDNNPTSRFPIVTVGLIVACVLVFIWQLNFPENQRLSEAGFGHIDQSSLEYGAIPYRITHTSAGKCDIGAVGEFAPGQFEAGVVCPGTKDYAEAVARSQANPSADLGPFQIDQKPWYETLFTSMFMHGGWLHIIGNMLFLWVFGNNIEDKMGRLKFLLFYVTGRADRGLHPGADRSGHRRHRRSAPAVRSRASSAHMRCSSRGRGC